MCHTESLWWELYRTLIFWKIRHSVINNEWKWELRKRIQAEIERGDGTIHEIRCRFSLCPYRLRSRVYLFEWTMKIKPLGMHESCNWIELDSELWGGRTDLLPHKHAFPRAIRAPDVTYLARARSSTSYWPSQDHVISRPFSGWSRRWI